MAFVKIGKNKYLNSNNVVGFEKIVNDDNKSGYIIFTVLNAGVIKSDTYDLDKIENIIAELCYEQ